MLTENPQLLTQRLLALQAPWTIAAGQCRDDHDPVAWPDPTHCGPDLANERQVTDTNAFVEEYALGRSELIDFESEAGIRLQGTLLYPANHDPARQYPMIVYAYEILSPQTHAFQVPNERSYYNFTAWSQHGYFVLLPDIVFRARDPGVSLVEAVRPAVRAVVERIARGVRAQYPGVIVGERPARVCHLFRLRRGPNPNAGLRRVIDDLMGGLHSTTAFLTLAGPVL
jgi:hypothetical protein